MRKLSSILGFAVLSLSSIDVSWQLQENEQILGMYRQLYAQETPWDVFLAKKAIDEYLERAREQLGPYIKMEQEAIRLRDPYGSSRAKVRMGMDISTEERHALKVRYEWVKGGIENFLKLDKPLPEEEIPRIALCGSGGGVRAALCTLGFLIGAADIEFLDCVLYASALSGSAWLMGSLFSDTRDEDGKLLRRYKDNFIKHLGHGLMLRLNPLSVKLATENLLTKFYYGQPLSLIDFWGIMIGEIMLQNLGLYWHKAALSSQADLMETGAYPFPLYSSIMPMGSGRFEWFEVSPYEVWSDYLKMAIPTWAFGRKFDNGVSKDFAPEQSLGFYLGVFGSAFELDLTDFMRHMGSFLKNPILKGFIKVLLTTSMKDMRLSPAEFRNYTYGMAQSIIPDKQNITLIDAGIDFNLPFPPLLRSGRNLDVIIFLDGSARIKGGREMQGVLRYAQEHGIPMPTINIDELHMKAISVFDDNLDAPICVYMPRIKNDQYDPNFDPDICAVSGFCNTMNFEYNEEQACLLSGLTEANMVQSKEILQDVIREAIRRRKAKFGEELERNK
ncbi:hypothetical protein A3F06_04165 [candidate division TM6 bacterium RIFCSPHIGHO2_12_FULL_36_22]|nr:MAG: hypothetical protein A3F06_04165 [candidate division TM6 bacterium RIFCSPHIGHO2_12_FULL_36_22]